MLFNNILYIQPSYFVLPPNNSKNFTKQASENNYSPWQCKNYIPHFSDAHLLNKNIQLRS